MTKSNLALFDLDGTLFNTEDVNYYAYKEVLSPFGLELKKDYFVRKCNGRHYTEFLPMIMGDVKHVEEVHYTKKIAYINHLDKAKENRQLFQMIKCMKETYHLGIVTTASRQNSLDILKYFGYENLFEHLVTQEDITKVKPDPQGYVMAMQYFGMDSAHTVIFEDSEVGIEAAKKTGATVMVVEQI